MIDPEVWYSVPDSQIQPSPPTTNGNKGQKGQRKTQVAQPNQFLIFLLVKRAGRVEVIDPVPSAVVTTLSFPFSLTLVVVMTSHVGREVGWPASQLLPQQGDGRHQWRILG